MKYCGWCVITSHIIRTLEIVIFRSYAQTRLSGLRFAILPKNRPHTGSFDSSLPASWIVHTFSVLGLTVVYACVEENAAADPSEDERFVSQDAHRHQGGAQQAASQESGTACVNCQKTRRNLECYRVASPIHTVGHR